MIVNADKYLYSKVKTEQQFKMLYIKKEINTKDNYVFCIETEETVMGFPDVMELVCLDVNYAKFYEFKISDSKGKIKFQPTQPSFYKAHWDMDIDVVAFNKKTGNIHTFSVHNLFNKGSMYLMNEKAEVNLGVAEKYYEGENESINN